MSVQLTVFPQNYEGNYQSISANSYNYISNGEPPYQTLNDATLNFIDLSGYPNTSTWMRDAIDLTSIYPTSPINVNEWYCYSNSNPGYLSSSIVIFPDTQITGIFTCLTNLTPGAVYRYYVEVPALNNPSTGGVLKSSVFSLADASGGNTELSGAGLLSSIPGYSVLNNYLEPGGNFTATNTEHIIAFEWTPNTVSTGVAGDLLYLFDMVCNLDAELNTGTIDSLADGQVILDLYEDEDIPLTLSIDNFINAAEKVQSYSKAFNLPATKRNSRIFNQIYEITRSGNNSTAFNPYRKTKALLKQNGFILFDGYLRLLDVSDKNGDISYNVNLYSEVIALADILKEKTFEFLPLAELTHGYTKANITNSWNDTGTGINYTNPNQSGLRDDNITVKYPFCDWNHQIVVANGAYSSASTTGNPEIVTPPQAFRPWLQLKYLIDLIFSSLDFTYTSTFFDTADFKKLYMDFNWGADVTMPNYQTVSNITQGGNMVLYNNDRVSAPYNPAAYGGLISFTNFSPSAAQMSPQINHVYSGGAPYGSIYKATYDGQVMKVDFKFVFQGVVALSTQYVEGRWRHTVDATGDTSTLENGTNVTNTLHNDDYWSSATFGYGQTVTWQGSLTVTMDKDDLLFCEHDIESGSANSVNCSLASVSIQTIGEEIVNGTLLGSQRGELGQWDFLKGIFTMFNLLTLPDPEDSQNIIIETYNEVFPVGSNSGSTSDLSLKSRGIAHDWTKKVDISQIKLKPIPDLQKSVMFKYVEDDDDYMFQNFKSSVQGHLYGSKEVTFPSYDILEGTKEVTAEPFAATIMKPYMLPQYEDLITPSLYSMTDDGETEGFENSPRILYNNGKVTLDATTNPTSYFFPKFHGVGGSNLTEYLMFSHLSELPTVAGNTLDVNFGAQQLCVPNETAPPRNLYSLYHSRYYLELYNPDTRIMTLKVNLSAADIQMFKFNDTVFIKNRLFRVNKIDYKPNDLATVEFILLP
tara:strand:- start:93 stop:3029 length:2937 start_codon:yes stop_codon:yes gene_type:complete